MVQKMIKAKKIWKASGKRQLTSLSPIHARPSGNQLQFSADIGVAKRTVIEPVTNSDSGGDQHALDHDQLSSGVSLCRLRLPCC